MPEPRPYRLRLRLPDGTELEAEGDREFILTEREIFLSRQAPKPPRPPEPPQDYPEPRWTQLIEKRGRNIQLRAKFRGDRGEKEACLVLLAGSEALLQTPKPTSAQLARWLRSSGHPIQRVDRTLAEAVENGEILASGSRRARRYELAGPGKARAFLLAHELESLLAGPPQL